MSDPDGAATGSLTDGEPPSDERLRPGTVIAERYRLERPVGTGGSATIWEATHLTLNRPVAVKFVDVVGPRQAQLRARFVREARVAAAIRHRNVVDIVDFGADGEQPFMIMELLEGRTLARRLAEGAAFTVGEAVQVVAPMLSGLAAVHDAGIVHRDLKPENVFLVQDGDGVYPKLIDFGVSRVLQSEAGLQSVLPTRDDVIVGTPQYMSPEQARGLREIDHRADIWSAGVILYELLCGSLPFDADAVGDVIIEVATSEVPPITDLRPDLAGPLAEVVHGALARAPSERFPTALAMRAALLAAVKEIGASILARAPARGDWDVEQVADELDLLDASLAAPRRREPARRDETLTLASTSSSSAPRHPARWLALVAALGLALGVAGWAAWAPSGSPSPSSRPATAPAPPASPDPAPEPARPPAPAPRLATDEPEPAPTDEDAAPSEPEAPARRPRRRPRLVRDPGF